MNANPKFLNATAHVDEAAVQPLPNSRKVYVEGSRPDIRVPMREITQSDTPASLRRGEEPADLRLRHLGPVHRPGGRRSTSARACAPLRAEVDRGAQRHRGARRPELALRARAPRRSEARAAALQPEAQAAPREAGHERVADALRAPRHHHAGDGIHRDPREPAPRRRCPSSSRAQHRGRVLRRRDPEGRSRPSSCATRSRAAARSSRPTSTTRKPSR